MKKTFKLEDLDCANCAAKMEAAINKLEGVQKATVSFMTQKLTLEAEEERFDESVLAAETAKLLDRKFNRALITPEMSGLR